MANVGVFWAYYRKMQCIFYGTGVVNMALQQANLQKSGRQYIDEFKIVLKNVIMVWDWRVERTSIGVGAQPITIKP